MLRRLPCNSVIEVSDGTRTVLTSSPKRIFLGVHSRHVCCYAQALKYDRPLITRRDRENDRGNIRRAELIQLVPYVIMSPAKTLVLMLVVASNS